MAKGLSPTERMALFERMLLIRRFEEAIIDLAPDHPYIGRQHLYIGHEAVAAPAAAVLGANDLCFTTHRNHGYIIARGVAPGRALAEVLGRAGGTNGGRGGPWHITERDAGFLATSAMESMLSGGIGSSRNRMSRGSSFLARSMACAGLSFRCASTQRSTSSPMASLTAPT